MNAPIEETILRKLKQLSPERLAEVEDFVEFLAAKERREQAIARLRALRQRQPPEEITDQEMQEIVAEVKAYRAEKRAEREHAGRS
jgi:hypothetical protein